MHQHTRWLTILVALGLGALLGIGLLRGGQADDPKRLTADDVIDLWKPMPDGVKSFQQFRASPQENPGLAAGTFRVVGPSFEALWNYYAVRFGIEDRYKPERLLVSGKKGAKGSYVVSDGGDAMGGRALSVFLLRTDRYTVTVTIQPDPTGKAVYGSIAAAIP
jgi:hypothetical protein